jgi:hypothetical protein
MVNCKSAESLTPSPAAIAGKAGKMASMVKAVSEVNRANRTMNSINREGGGAFDNDGELDGAVELDMQTVIPLAQ